LQRFAKCFLFGKELKMPAIPLQFVFQGGGAKLGALVAAGEAVHEQRGDLDFRISSVSGTSAGAIAACMLASGRMPQLRERLRGIAQTHVKGIVRSPSLVSLGWNLWRGNPLYDVKAYKRFLDDLFTLADEKFERLRDLRGCDEILIHAVDIHDRRPFVFRKSQNGDMRIVDALFNSSALPFIFRSYKAEQCVMDGGVANNFPCADLLAATHAGSVLGFSFEPQGYSEEISGVGQFAAAIVSTMMDNATFNAVEALRKNGHVCFIKTKRKTLDFEEAIKDDLAGSNFVAIKDQAKDFLKSACAEIRRHQFVTSPDKFIEKVLQLYRTYAGQQVIHASRVLIRYTSNSLDQRNPNIDDSRAIELEFTASEPMFVFGMRLSTKVDIISKVIIEDAERNRVNATVLEIPIDYVTKKADQPADNIIICFHRPLVAGKKYVLKLTTSAREVLYDIINKDKNCTDYIEFDAVRLASVERLVLVAYIPRDMDVGLSDYGSEYSGVSAWKAGSQVSAVDLDRLDGLPGPNFKAIAWQATELVKGNVTGFAVTARSG
jgi:predicted acylesterase/phospholipase RssA